MHRGARGLSVANLRAPRRSSGSSLSFCMIPSAEYTLLRAMATTTMPPTTPALPHAHHLCLMCSTHKLLLPLSSATRSPHRTPRAFTPGTPVALCSSCASPRRIRHARRAHHFLSRECC
ncbi:hypothetical protein DFH09DRAFT_1315106 [Mycena vulgaris]|nr:hypothetical protein DFH09DRAFT_1315106 [Mycena vulgaris]